jgi:hypothetical protein
MYLTYKPEGSEEAQEFVFIPEDTNTFDSEAIESATGWTWEEFLMNLRKGSTKARRVLLWICTRRVHRGLQLRDVQFKQSEVKLEYDVNEMKQLREGVLESPDQPGIDKDLILAAMDAEIGKARPGPEGEGKAPEPHDG